MDKYDKDRKFLKLQVGYIDLYAYLAKKCKDLSDAALKKSAMLEGEVPELSEKIAADRAVKENLKDVINLIEMIGLAPTEEELGSSLNQMTVKFLKGSAIV